MQPKCQFLTTLQKKNSPIMALYSFSKTSSSKPILLYRRTDRILSCKDGMNNKRKEKVLLTLKQFWPWTLWHALLCVPLAPPCLHMSSRRWKFWRFCIVVFKVFFFKQGRLFQEFRQPELLLWSSLLSVCCYWSGAQLERHCVLFHIYKLYLFLS